MAAKDDQSPTARLTERALGQAADEFASAVPGAGTKLAQAVDAAADTVRIVFAGGRDAVALVDKMFRGMAGLAGYGYRRLADELGPRLSKKLEAVPEERRQTPDEAVAGPALESARFLTHKPELMEMFANLLTTAMDSSTADNAHPAFVEVLRQLSPDEAKILAHIAESSARGTSSFPAVDLRVEEKGDAGYIVLLESANHLGKDAGIERENLLRTYIGNLRRLELVTIPHDAFLTAKDIYQRLENDPELLALKKQHDDEKRTVTFEQRVISLTPYGRSFIQACVRPATE